MRAAVFVASRATEGGKLNVKDIAREIDAPEPFTAKILQVLNRHHIITSLKGPYGGFFIEDYQLDQPIINIVEAIDGMDIFRECGLGLKQCSATHPCPLHDKFQETRESLRRLFQETTLRQLAEQLITGDAFINNF